MIDREAIRARLPVFGTYTKEELKADIVALLDALDEAEAERDAEREVSVAGAAFIDSIANDADYHSPFAKRARAFLGEQ